MPRQRNDICGVGPLVKNDKEFKAFDADWLIEDLNGKDSTNRYRPGKLLTVA